MNISAQDYKSLLTDIIKKQIVILGPAITLAKIRQVRGLSVADDGTVTGISDKPEAINKQLIEHFTELSGPIVKKTMSQLMQATVTTPPPPTDDDSSEPTPNDTQQITSNTEQTADNTLPETTDKQEETSKMEETSDAEQATGETQQVTSNK